MAGERFYDESPFVIDDKEIFPLDSVTVIRILKDHDNPEAYAALDEMPAAYLGRYFRGNDEELVPLIALQHRDGTIEQLWNDECDWTHPEIYRGVLEWDAQRRSAHLN